MDNQTDSQDKLVKQPSATKKVNDISIDNLPDLLTVAEVATFYGSANSPSNAGVNAANSAIRINARGSRRYRKEAVLWLLGIKPSNPSTPCPLSNLIFTLANSYFLKTLRTPQ